MSCKDSPTATRSFAWVSVVSLVLAGCGGQPLKMSEMSAQIRADLQSVAVQAHASNRKVARLSRNMAPAVLEAVTNNEAYRAALLREKEALASIGVSQSDRLPQFTGNANLGVIREDGGGQDETTAGGSGGINMSQLLYDGGESAANVNRATAQALAARSERLARANELALKAASAWIDVWQHKERLRRLRERMSELEILIGQIGRMASSGMLDRGALDSARRELVNIRLEEAGLESDLEEARIRFARYFQAKPIESITPTELVTLAQARAEAKKWRGAPALRRSVAELLVARSNVSGAEAAFRPRARLQAGVTSPLEANESTDSSVGVVFEYTFGDGGKRESQLQSAQAGLEAAQALLADERSNLEADLKAALVKLRSLEQSLALVSEKIRLTTSEAETARSQIVTGQSSLRLLVDAEIENFRARDQQVSMRAEALKLQLTIAARTGALGNIIGLESEGNL